MSEEELKKEMEELVKNKMDTFIECYKNGMIFGAPTDIEFYEKIATLQQKVEEKDKEIDRLNNIINECMESVSCIEHNLEKYEEIGLDHFDYALEKTRELKEYLYEELKEE